MDAGRSSLVLDPLIGRGQELAGLHRALETARVVTITGLGGVGKTRLALAELERVADEGGTVGIADLSAVAGVDDTLAAIADALGVAESPDTELLDALIASAERRRALVVLDAFEHVLEARALVEELLARSTAVRLIVTSRVATGIDGETELRLGPLPAAGSGAGVEGAPAGQLFLQRARQLGRLRVLDEDDSEAIAVICRALDGVPLALELAAAWVRVLSPRAIARRLDDGRLVLGRDGHGRQASLERIVESTLDLVDAADRAAFETLSLFAAAFDETAAAAVTGVDAPLRTLLALEAASLVRTLVEPDGEPRYVLLDTIRSVAARRLADREDAHIVRRRFVASYATRAQEAADRLRDLSPAPALAWMGHESPNLQAAFELALAAPEPALAVQLAMTMATYGVRSGSVRRSLRRLEAALVLAPIPPGIRSEALCAEINLAVLIGKPIDAIARGEEAVALAQLAGDPRREVRALIALADHGRPPDAAAILEHAASLATEIGYAWGAAVAADGRATMAVEAGQWQLALELFRDTAVRARAANDTDSEAIAQASLAEMLVNLGRAPEAVEPAGRAVDLMGIAWPESAMMVWVLANRATVDALARRPAEAYAGLAAAGVVADIAEAEPGFEDLLEAAVVVFAGGQPAEAARALGRWETAVAVSRPRVARRPVIARSAERIERALGRRRFEAERRAGAAMDIRDCVDLVRSTAASAAEVASRHRGEYGALTGREEQVLALLAKGRTDPEIAEDLGISPKTASVHVTNIKSKLGVDNRIEVALLARELVTLGFLDDPAPPRRP